MATPRAPSSTSRPGPSFLATPCAVAASPLCPSPSPPSFTKARPPTDNLQGISSTESPWILLTKLAIQSQAPSTTGWNNCSCPISRATLQPTTSTTLMTSRAKGLTSLKSQRSQFKFSPKASSQREVSQCACCSRNKRENGRLPIPECKSNLCTRPILTLALPREAKSRPSS